MGEANRQNSLPRVLYIMGTARSGSTVLEILLSANPNVFGAGEVTALVQDGFIENRHCSCGQPCLSCSVWDKVICALNVDKGLLAQWATLQKKVDWHNGFLRQCVGAVSKKSLEQYKFFNVHLLKCIGAVTGASWIVDSSKYAGRALALKRIKEVDISVICLTRSPSGLMTSFQKQNKNEQKPKSPLGTLIYYLVTLASLRITMSTLGDRVISVHYEDLLTNPVETLRKIEEWSGVDLTNARQRLQAKKTFSVGHLVTGNRLRKEGEIRFKSDRLGAEPRGLQAKMAVVLMNGWRRLFSV